MFGGSLCGTQSGGGEEETGGVYRGGSCASPDQLSETDGDGSPECPRASFSSPTPSFLLGLNPESPEIHVSDRDGNGSPQGDPFKEVDDSES